MTTKSVVTDEQMGQFSGKVWDLYRRVREGSVDFDKAMEELQRLSESRCLELSLSQRQAQAELGQDFITPEEAAKYLSYALTDEDIANLNELTLRSGRVLTLNDLRREKGKRVLHPVLPVSIPEMRQRFGIDPKKQPCFRREQDQYLDLRKAKFASTAPKPYWSFIAKEAEEGSFRISWYSQEKLLSSGERQTFAIEVCQAAFIVFLKTGIRLYQDFYAWCNDAHGVARVDAGGFHEDGFHFHYSHPVSDWFLYGLVSSLE